MVRSTLLAAVVFLSGLSLPAIAQEAEDLPYWASISAEEARMRVGAGERFPIEWVYTRPGLPIKVIRFHQGWRLIEEPDGTQGWMFASLLSRKRTAIVTGEEKVAMRDSGSTAGRLLWNLEPGVVADLGDCAQGWCEVDIDGHRGWVAQNRLWGAGEP